MDISRFLARVIGMYLVIISTDMFMNMQQFVLLVQGVVTDRYIMFFSAFIIIILGLLMVLSHNIWQMNWRVLITIFAWLTLLKGVFILFMPGLIISYTMIMVRSLTCAYVGAFINFAVGCLLAGVGFRSMRRGAKQ